MSYTISFNFLLSFLNSYCYYWFIKKTFWINICLEINIEFEETTNVWTVPHILKLNPLPS